MRRIIIGSEIHALSKSNLDWNEFLEIADGGVKPKWITVTCKTIGRRFFPPEKLVCLIFSQLHIASAEFCHI